MAETTFENARVGEKVWDVSHGWGEIINTQNFPSYPLSVRFEQGNIINYDFAGRRSIYQNRILFWDEIKIIAPERPKRKVKKTVWFNVWRVRAGEIVACEYEDGAEADEDVREDKSNTLLDRFTREYEVEE